MRSRRETIIFGRPFLIKSIGRQLPAGGYEVVTDEELIEGLSFASYRRIATMMMVPSGNLRGSSMEMPSIDYLELSEAQRVDAEAT